MSKSPETEPLMAIFIGMDQLSPPAKARVSQSDVAVLYDRLAGVYDLWGHLTESKARNRALELADIHPGQQVLEVAVGTGLAFVHIVRRNPEGRNIGIDISGGMLAKAKRRLQKAGLTNYQLSIGSALAIAEPDASFDVLLNNYMFDLLDEPQWTQAITEFRRVLKPDGLLVLANMTQGETPGSGIYERLYRLSPSLMGGCRGVRMSEALEHNGFSVILREYVQQMLFPTEVILASRRRRVFSDQLRSAASDSGTGSLPSSRLFNARMRLPKSICSM